MNDQPANTAPEKPQLGLWSTVSIIVGIVVGVSIFKLSGDVFRHAGSVDLFGHHFEGPWMGLGVWALGGVLSLVGALCYAELATTYPRSGGDYVYLSRAYGRWVGFLFGWAQLAVILTASIGTMAYAFATFAARVFPLDGEKLPWVALGVVVTLTVFNVFGVAFGKVIQNILTGVKILGLLAIVAAGFFWHGVVAAAPVGAPPPSFGLGLSLVFVLYAFGGWNDAAFVAAEVRQSKRNLPLALILGTLGITVIYLLVNVAYLWGLGFERLRASDAPAADLFKALWNEPGERFISVLVMTSALAAVNGLIFTGARVYSSLGADHKLFAVLGHWHPRFRTPVWSLLAQGAIACLLILAVGLETGQRWIDSAIGSVGIQPLPWKGKFGDGFSLLVSATAPVFWLFFLLTGLSIFVLRIKDRGIPRPFVAPFFPVLPIVFCISCGFMLYRSLEWAEALSLIGVVPLLVGLPLYVVSLVWQHAAEPRAVATDTPV